MAPTMNLSPLARRRYWAMQAISCLSHSMFRHDAIASVLQAFTPGEIISLRNRAGLGYVCDVSR
jgi:hypothetical protein